MNAEKEWYDILYTQNWKWDDTNELIYKTETDLQSELRVARGEEWGEIGSLVSTCTHCYT